MTTDLRERLADLATAAPYDVPTAHLWRQGRRRQARRALATTAAVVVISAMAGVGASSLMRSVESAEPVTSPADGLRLPDHLYRPSPWLAGTDDAGPLGPLVAVLGAERRSWTSSSVGLAGVSSSGEYRFLDLPGAVLGQVVQETSPALSADGTKLAYWITGPTTREPRLESGVDLPVGGMAVYDTVEGTITTRLVSSPYGLMADGIAWAGDVARFGYGTYDPPVFGGDSLGATLVGFASWDARTGQWGLTSDPRAQVGTQTSAGHDSFVATAVSGRGYVVIRADGSTSRFRWDHGVAAPPAPSPDGSRAAGIYQREPSVFDSDPHEIVVGPTSGPSPGRVTLVPGVLGNAVVGWRDDRHVVVASWGDEGGYASVDVETGATESLVSGPQGSNYWPGVVVAADAWQAPLVAVHEPDWPMDTRTRALLIALVVAAAWVGVILWGRRRGRA